MIDKYEMLAEFASDKNKGEISVDLLGETGSPSHLVFSFEFKDDRFAGKNRFEDTAEREFNIRARLLRRHEDANSLDADITPNQGASYVRAPEGKVGFSAGTEGPSHRTELHLAVNDKNQISMAMANLKARTPFEAYEIFLQTLNLIIDRMSFIYNVPFFVGMINVYDLLNEMQHIFYTSPPREVTIDEIGESLNDEMQPVYALYREAKNSQSPYYKLLCLYKIMEGLFGPLQVKVRKISKDNKVELNVPKAVVPPNDRFLPEIKGFVGKSIKDYYDNFLTKEYRHAVAHFELGGRNPLNVSSARDAHRFASVAFATDICVRILIARQDQMFIQAKKM